MTSMNIPIKFKIHMIFSWYAIQKYSIVEEKNLEQLLLFLASFPL
jgi:hypothetical protein